MQLNTSNGNSWQHVSTSTTICSVSFLLRRPIDKAKLKKKTSFVFLLIYKIPMFVVDIRQSSFLLAEL